MSEQYNPWQENEISIKSQGGTERVKRNLATKIPDDLAQNFQIICSRVRELRPDKIRIYHIHDLPGDGETNHMRDENSRERFHKIIFCGHWQYNQYLTSYNLPITDKFAVIDTPIEIFKDLQPKPTDKINLIYTSTPQRGLALLVPVFVKLAEKYPNIHLDVFSSFKIYGWDEADKQFEELYETCRQHPQITYHGFADNKTVRETLKSAHIFAYPSIWPECNSQSLIEAMSAGCLCVHPNFAGLSDTSGGLTAQYQWLQDPNQHANKFYHLLEHAVNMVNDQGTQNYLKFVKMYADSRYNIDKIAAIWQDMMVALNGHYQTVESRAIPAAQYIVRPLQ